MIVVDTNIIAYLDLPGEFTVSVERLLERDTEWVAPRLWRSEFRNLLSLYVRHQRLPFEDAYGIQRKAEALIRDDVDVDSFEVLNLARSSGCTAYDCESSRSLVGSACGWSRTMRRCGERSRM